MPKVYWIGRVDVRDAEAYKEYVAIGRPAYERNGAKFLARGGKIEVLEGQARARNEPFESGVVAASPERLRLSAKFYLVAMFFVIFDVEALFLYAYAVSAKEVGWMGWIEAAIFIFILTASLVYLARIGALDWTPHQKKRRAARVAAQQAGKPE